MMMPIKPDREYRALMQPLQTKIDSEYYVEGYATTFEPYLLYEIDGVKYYEKIDRGALDGADMSDVIMQYDHMGKVLARMSNGTLGINIDNNGLHVYADLSKSAAAKELYEEIKNGLVTKMSWAFTVAEDDYDRDNRMRIIKRVKKVYDVSAVSIPANADTEISARAWLNGVIEAQRRESFERQAKIDLAKAKYFYFGG
jgi:HK97 family phage prohead protease